jgi:hypothetical protein
VKKFPLGEKKGTYPIPVRLRLSLKKIFKLLAKGQGLDGTNADEGRFPFQASAG